MGTTTLAINTAIALHKEMKKKVVLVDANFMFGDHRVFLDLGPDQRSIIDVVTATAIDADVLRQVVVRHDTGVDLLLAPPTPEAADLISGEQHHLLRIIELLRTMYDYVLVDLDERLDDHQLDVIGAADRLIVVMTADLSCVKNVRLVLGTMGSLGVPDERLLLVLNRANAFTGISPKSVESVLRRQVSQQIVNDYRTAISSLNSGTPFMHKRPDSALGPSGARVRADARSAGRRAGRAARVPSADCLRRRLIAVDDAGVRQRRRAGSQSGDKSGVTARQVAAA